MVEIVGIAGAVIAVVLTAGRAVREMVHDGYGRRAAIRPGGLDSSQEWSLDLPSRPYREM